MKELHCLLYITIKIYISLGIAVQFYSLTSMGVITKTSSLCGHCIVIFYTLHTKSRIHTHLKL